MLGKLNVARLIVRFNDAFFGERTKRIWTHC
jgi:hypothetical protein